MDVLVLNTAVADFRHEDFGFADALAGTKGLAICNTDNMPGYSQKQFAEWIQQGYASAGGPGNTAPLMAMAGLKVGVGVNLGAGDYDGFDAQGRFFYDVMIANGIDMSSTFKHPKLPTGTTFIHRSKVGDRTGIAYFPNANDDFNFEDFKPHVTRLKPNIVYYMYCGLSKRGDAGNGRDLADFMRWCRAQGAIVIADSHTLTGSVQESIASGLPVEGYRLLEPILPELDIFFTSSDEAMLIHNTLLISDDNAKIAYSDHVPFLDRLCSKYCRGGGRTRLLGVTVSEGAFQKHILPDGKSSIPEKVLSRFMAGDVIDLVGAGDSFRAGLVTYIARNINSFRDGTMNFNEAVQMGNLFASVYIKAPLSSRYRIEPYEQMIEHIRGGSMI
ncbi:MAG: pfkB family carbohydrate kinase [Acidobacteria bacterium]|nr:pfkB family carbohydrate kinase [Acidobacteriota bacterium]